MSTIRPLRCEEKPMMYTMYTRCLLCSALPTSQPASQPNMHCCQAIHSVTAYAQYSHRDGSGIQSYIPCHSAMLNVSTFHALSTFRGPATPSASSSPNDTNIADRYFPYPFHH
ncbi:hypothetical protein DM02DRAFT_392961 [Periconia macrospinosa]|uniref:Uncharacterized protein n=1 Tax=Periconia macrospinosa TaxID=97972 RepID=A0A2V1DR20_9PLEO|nr:hypothetical protein DM02DRAFT_392961 [Periconia macrospinosa]